MEHFVSAAFAKAERIEFWPGEPEDSPGLVILVFKSRESATSAAGCYKYLLDICGIKTHLLMSPTDNTVSIVIKDEERGIEIPIRNLAFSVKQLNTFKSKCNAELSFAFCLGEDMGETRPVLIPADADFTILTMHGYTIK